MYLEGKEPFYFRAALLQMTAGRSLEENLEKGEAFVRRAKEMGADLALFPELWSSGYCLEGTEEELGKRAVSRDSRFVRRFGELARELSMAVAITYLEKWEPSPRNTVTVFDRFGRNVLTYAKVHTCDFADERKLTPGEEFPAAELDTGRGTVRIGAMICYDREFPESARILMLKGAEILLVPNACPMEVNRLSQLRARAFENMVGIATANYARGHAGCNGRSSAFDGVAWEEENEEGQAGAEAAASRDMEIAEAGEGEEILMAGFNLSRLRAYREREVHGNAYRRPGLYGILTERTKNPPFIRDGCRE